jgi:hypothetical protein
MSRSSGCRRPWTSAGAAAAVGVGTELAGTVGSGLGRAGGVAATGGATGGGTGGGAAGGVGVG